MSTTRGRKLRCRCGAYAVLRNPVLPRGRNRGDATEVATAGAIRDLPRRPMLTGPLEWLRYRHEVQTTEAEWLPSTRVNTAPPTMWLGSTCHSLSVGRKLGHTDAASSIRHRWHRIAPWFRYPRWLCRRAVARIRDRRDLVPAVAQGSRMRGMDCSTDQEPGHTTRALASLSCSSVPQPRRRQWSEPTY